MLPGTLAESATSLVSWIWQSSIVMKSESTTRMPCEPPVTSRPLSVTCSLFSTLIVFCDALG